MQGHCLYPDQQSKSNTGFSLKVGFNISPVIMKLHSGEFICRANFKGREEEFIFSLTVLEPTKFVPLPYINQVKARTLLNLIAYLHLSFADAR